MGFCFQLNYQDYNVYNAYNRTIPLNHFKKAFEGTLPLKEKLVHVALATIEVLPLIGPIIAIMEWMIVKYFSQPTPNPDTLKVTLTQKKEDPVIQPALEALKPKLPVIEEIDVKKNYFQKLLLDPYSLCKDSDFQTDFPHIKICPCLPAKFRSELEAASIDKIKTLFLDKEKEFTIVSVGAGRCFQELVYLAHIVNLGYGKINLVVIDQNHDVTAKAVADLNQFKDQFFQSSKIAILNYASIEEYLKEAINEKLQPQLLLMIDLEEIVSLSPPRMVDTVFDSLSPQILKDQVIVTYTNKEFDQEAALKSKGKSPFVTKGICGRFVKGDLSQLAETQECQDKG